MVPHQPSDLRWDPLDATLKDDPHPVWKRLRDEAPVYFNEELGFWALSRYADVERAHRDPTLFSSAHRTVLELMSPEASRQGLMIFLDPPEHTGLRRLVSRAFTPRRVAQLEDEIRAVCVGLLDPLRDRSHFDYVADFAARVPAIVIAALLGVPHEDREPVRHRIDSLFHLDPKTGMFNEVAAEAMAWLASYMDGQFDERTRHPRDDMLTDLLGAEVPDENGTTRRLTRSEAREFSLLLISAGTETVARLLSWAAVVLDAHPGQRAELARDRNLIPGAVEELLRYEAPSPVQGRWLTADLELHGTTIPAESKVLLLTGSAGRDERAFPDADRFDIRRRVDLHLSFGYGIHFCLGAALARMEGRIALEETLARYPTWSVDAAGLVPLHTSTVRGYSHVPFEVDACVSS
ncbi:MAG TPA: cytochrome P450 [Acidimicrobiales bacterium]|nr:cytochrome P450 [Acidimicrobiales bacterium]